MEESVIQALATCMSPDNEVRKQSEAFITSLKAQPGFYVLLLQISQNSSYPLEIRQIAVILLKNSALKWKKGEIPADSKAVIKSSILNCLKKSAPVLIRTQLEEIVQVLGKQEYPWEGINDQIHSFLDSNDPDCIFAALVMLQRISKNYEFIMGEKRSKLKILVSSFFPKLDQLFTRLISEISESVYPYISLILQIFWAAFYIELPSDQVNESNINNWLAKILSVLSLDFDLGIPSNADEEEQKAQDPKLLCKKWAIQIAYRFFNRYSNIKNLPDSQKIIGEIFITNWMVSMMNIVVVQLFKYKQVFLPELYMNYSLKYVTECIKNDQTCEIIKNMVLANGRFVIPALINEIITPVLCRNSKDEELWQDNAIEFIRKEADISRTYYSASDAAVSLLESLCKKGYLQQFLDYLNGSLAQGPSLIVKEALIYEVGSLSSVFLENESLKEKIEPMLSGHVFAELTSQVGFLRARSCWAYGQFASFPFTNLEHQQAVLEKICALLLDPDMPVKYQAALTIPKILSWQISKTRVRGEISSLLRIYLDLINQIDSEDIIEALEDIVQNFEEEVGPYAVDLVSQLVITFSKLASKEPAQDGGDSAMAAVSTLNTIARLIETTTEKSEELIKVSHVITPVLMHCLSKNGFEYMDEGLNLLLILLYEAPAGSLPHLYSLCKVVLNSLQPSDPYGIEKAGEIYPVLGNFIAKYTDLVVRDLNEIVMFLLVLLTSEAKAQCLALNILMALTEYIKNHMAQILPQMIQAVVGIFNNDSSVKVKSLCAQFFFETLWLDFTTSVKLLQDSACLASILAFVLAHKKVFTERVPRTRAIVGISSLIPHLPSFSSVFDEELIKKTFNLLVEFLGLAEEDSEGDEDDDDNLDAEDKNFDEKCQEMYKKIKENLEDSDEEGALFDNEPEQRYDSYFENINYRGHFKEAIGRTPQDLLARLVQSLEFNQKAMFSKLVS